MPHPRQDRNQIKHQPHERMRTLHPLHIVSDSQKPFSQKSRHSLTISFTGT